MEKQQTDYGQPLVFFGILIFLSTVSFYIEKYLGIGPVIIFVLWAILTMKVFIWISQRGLSYEHPASFFALALTFTFVGFYIGQVLNIETFIWLVLWVIAVLVARAWINNNPRAGKRLFHLLSVQFVALAIIVPLLLQCANQALIAQPTVSGHVITEKVDSHHNTPSSSAHVKSEHDVQLTTEIGHQFDQFLLVVLQRLIFLLSVLVAISAWRARREQLLGATTVATTN